MKTRYLGLADYCETWTAMRTFTDSRLPDDEDELWVCEHPPVYTLGQAGRREHILNAELIPVISSDRGGQVTYHGPGQVVIYTLVNLRRAGFGVRDMVIRLENSVISVLKTLNIDAVSRRDAPGVYVNNAKIAALGLRVRKGSTYHGLAMNLDVDLAPFRGINPCGYAGLTVTSTQSQGVTVDNADIIEMLVLQLHRHLVEDAMNVEQAR